MSRLRRFEILSRRDVNSETFVEPRVDAGLIVVDSPYDPEPGLRIEGDQVIEMDGRTHDQFDALDL